MGSLLLSLSVSGAGGGQEGGDATQSRCSLGFQTDIEIEDGSILLLFFRFHCWCFRIILHDPCHKFVSNLQSLNLVKNDCTLDGQRSVGGLSPILTKLAPGVRFGPKPNSNPPFRPFRPIEGAYG